MKARGAPHQRRVSSAAAPLTPPAGAQATLALPKDDPAQADSIARMRQLTNAVRARARPLQRPRAPAACPAPAASLTLAAARAQWVAKYRRNGAYTGRASYGCVGAAARKGDKGLPRAARLVLLAAALPHGCCRAGACTPGLTRPVLLRPFAFPAATRTAR